MLSSLRRHCLNTVLLTCTSYTSGKSRLGGTGNRWAINVFGHGTHGFVDCKKPYPMTVLYRLLGAINTAILAGQYPELCSYVA